MFDLEKLTQGPKGSLLIADMVFSGLAVVLSGIVLSAITNSRFDLAGYRCFLISFAISDLFTASVNLIRFIYVAVHYQTNQYVDLACSGSFLRSLQLAGLCANLLSLCAMSTDHFFGIVYPSRYSKFMTRRVTGTALFLIWIFSFISGFIDAPIAATAYLTGNPNADLTMDAEFSFPIKDIAAFLPIKSDTLDKDPSALIDVLKEPLIANKKSGLEVDLAMIFDASLSMEKFDTSLKHSQIDTLSNLLSKPPKQSSSTPFDVEQFLYDETQRIVRQRRIESDWCSFYMSNRSLVEFLLMGLTLSCFVFIVFCYGGILKHVLNNNDPAIHKRVNQVLTTCVLLGAFIISRVPFVAFEFTMTLLNDPSVPIPVPMSTLFFKAHNVLDTLFISYPFVDVVICIARVRVVRKFVFEKYFSLPACCKAIIRRNFYAGGQTLATMRPQISTTDMSSYYHGQVRPSTSSSHALITPSQSNDHWYPVPCYSNHNCILKDRHSSNNNSSSDDSQTIIKTE